MFKRPTKALFGELQRFVFRHAVFVEAREFDDGRIFVREPKGPRTKYGPHRNFRISLLRDGRRVHFCTVVCGSEDHKMSQVGIDFPEKLLLSAAEAAIEYEDAGRNVDRYSAKFRRDQEAGRALFGYVRSESQTLEKLLGDKRYNELLGIVRRHRPARRRVAT